MNILLINHYAGTNEMGMEFRPYYLAKEWIKQGHNVKIIAATFTHLRSKQPIVNQTYTTENIDGIDYFWIQTPKYEGNSIKRFINMLIFVIRLWFKARYLATKFAPQLVIASSTYPLDIFPARKIAKLSGAKLCFEIHDLWPLSPMELGGYSKYHPFIAIMQYAENIAYRYADKVISILPKTLEHTVNHGLEPNKWNCIPNGIDIATWQQEILPDADTVKLLTDIKRDNYFNIAYLGTHGIANALEYLLEAAVLLKNYKIKIILIGKGNEKHKLMEKYKEYLNILFIDFIPKKMVPFVLQQFDALYIGWRKNALYRFGISPNKIFDYMMAAKPIIHSVEAANDPVAEAECGISIQSENTTAIAEAILKISNMNILQLNEMGKKGKEFVIKNHTYNILAENFLKIFIN